MTHTNDPNDRLEQLTAAVLRELPARRAPRTLEARVFAEIERRAAKPWWQSSFTEWPALVRILFVLASIVTGVLAVRGSTWLFGESSSALSGIGSNLTPAASSMKTTFHIFHSVADSIPSVWIYGGLALMAVMYIALFGIGAAAYRTLHANR